MADPDKTPIWYNDKMANIKYMKKAAILNIFLLSPMLAFAQSGGSVPVSASLVQVFAVVNQIIPMLLALAVLVFLWGIVKFIANASDPEARSGGIQHMIWGMIGLFDMVGFWGIIGYVQESLQLNGGTITTTPAPVVDVTPGSN
jgi:hypothetical protein